MPCCAFLVPFFSFLVSEIHLIPESLQWQGFVVVTNGDQWNKPIQWLELVRKREQGSKIHIIYYLLEDSIIFTIIAKASSERVFCSWGWQVSDLGPSTFDRLNDKIIQVRACPQTWREAWIQSHFLIQMCLIWISLSGGRGGTWITSNLRTS